MWLSNWQDLIPETVATAVIAAGLRWFRPRQLIGYISSVIERETYMGMLDHETKAGAYWQAEAKAAQAECERLRDALARCRAGCGGGGTSGC